MGSSQQSTIDTADTLRKISVYIFLAVSACLVVVTARLAFDEIQGASAIRINPKVILTCLQLYP